MIDEVLSDIGNAVRVGMQLPPSYPRDTTAIAAMTLREFSDALRLGDGPRMANVYAAAMDAIAMAASMDAWGMRHACAELMAAFDDVIGLIGQY